MNLPYQERIKRLFVTRSFRSNSNSKSKAARRQWTGLEALETRDLLAALPIMASPPTNGAAAATTAAIASCAAPTPQGSGGDLNDWQSNYGSGGAASIGGGVDILIAEVDERLPAQAVDLAILCVVAKPTSSTSQSAIDPQGRLVLGTDQGVFRGGASTSDAPTGKLYVGTDVGVFIGAANNQGKLIVGVDNVDLNRGPISGSAGDDVLIGGQTTFETRAGGPTTATDDVYIEGRIITAENPASASQSQTIRLRIAATNNQGK